MQENEIYVTKAQVEKATAVMAEAIAIGSEGTQGDYTDLGLLAKMFETLDIKVVLS